MGGDGEGRGVALGVPRPSMAVKWLLAINAAVFVAQQFADRGEFGPGSMTRLLGVTSGDFWQVWRYITFQFLHADIWHIVLNMLGLYMLGSPLEQLWGTRRFLRFYLSCGVVAGVAFVLLGLFGLSSNTPIIGASGGVYAIVLACAVLFPHFQIIFVFFPVPIRLAAIIIFGVMALGVLQALAGSAPGAAASDVAHLGGAAAAAVWLWVVPRLGRRAVRAPGQGNWDKKLRQRRAMQEQIDRILDKVAQHGLSSLSWSEKRTLKQGTELQRQRDRKLDRGEPID